jgi:stress-induced morphogen
MVMICQRCRRVAITAARQIALSPRRAQSTLGSATYLARTSFQTKPFPRPTYARSLPYSTSSEAAPATDSSPATPTALAKPEKPDYLNEAETSIWEKLTAEFEPTELMVQDVSGGCGSMYGIEIASEKFRGTTMLKQQRMVNAALGEEMKEWHGVQLRTKVPS